MPLIATFALAASAGATLPQCSWDRPGVNPFMGDVVAAVDHYADIPAATREKLKARMKARSYDDIAVIERDRIQGQADYAPEIRDMHFGPGAICRTVTRTKWTPTTQERGLVYCEAGQCILVPTVCRNVSRIRRLDKPVAVASAHGSQAATGGVDSDMTAPLEFEPPAAGPMAAPPAAPQTFASVSGVPTLSSPPTGGNFSLPGVTLGMPSLPPGRVSTTAGPLPGDSVPAVPEPSTWAMIALGLVAVAFRARQQR